MAEDELCTRYEQVLKKCCPDEIKLLTLEDNRSLIFSFKKLQNELSDNAYLIIENPEIHLELLSNASKNATKTIDPEFFEKVDIINVRLRDIPTSQHISLKDGLRHKYRNQFVSVQGRITQFTMNNPVLKEAVYLCSNCGTLYEVQQNLESEQLPPIICENPSCQKKGNYKRLDAESTFRDCKIVMLSEGITELKVYLLDDLIDKNIRYGERILINGILKMVSIKRKDTAPSYTFYLIANYFEMLGNTECRRINEDIIRTHIEAHYNNFEEIIHSIHPASVIDSFLPQKMFPVMSYCSGGGWDKEHDQRLTINSLIVGVVGWFKTSIMERLRKIVGINNLGKASGQRTTKGGLVPIAIKDKDGRVQVFIGLLAEYDGRNVWIDEGQGLDLDSINGIADIESGYIPLTSYGQYLLLPTTGSITMTQNWIKIEYDPELTFSENLGLPTNILQRFDLIFEVGLPTPDEAECIVDSLETPPKWSDDDIFTYLEMVKEIYNSGKINFPGDIKEEFKGYWKDIYRLSKDGLLKNENLNIRSLNTLFKVLHWLSAAHLRYEITIEDSEYMKNKIIPHIIQFMKTKALDSVRIYGVESAFRIVKELLSEQSIVTLDMFVPRYRAYLLKMTNNSDYVNRKMPEDTTLDKNKPLRNLLEKMENHQSEYDLEIDKTQKKGTVIYSISTNGKAEKKYFPKEESGADRSDRADIDNMTNMTNMPTELSKEEKKFIDIKMSISDKGTLSDFHNEILDYVGTDGKTLISSVLSHFVLQGYGNEATKKSIEFLKNHGVLMEPTLGCLQRIDKI